MAYRGEILRSYLKPAYQYCEHKCSTKTSLLYRALLGPTATHGRAINPGLPSHGPRSSAKEKQISRVRPPHNTYLGSRNSVTKDFTEDKWKISFRDIPLLMILRSRRNVTLHHDGRRREEKRNKI